MQLRYSERNVESNRLADLAYCRAADFDSGLFSGDPRQLSLISGHWFGRIWPVYSPIVALALSHFDLQLECIHDCGLSSGTALRLDARHVAESDDFVVLQCH